MLPINCIPLAVCNPSCLCGDNFFFLCCKKKTIHCFASIVYQSTSSCGCKKYLYLEFLQLINYQHHFTILHYLFFIHCFILKSSEDEISSLRKKETKIPYLTQPSNSDEECEWTNVNVGIDLKGNKSTFHRCSNIAESSGEESIQPIKKKMNLRSKKVRYPLAKILLMMTTMMLILIWMTSKMA